MNTNPYKPAQVMSIHSAQHFNYISTLLLLQTAETKQES